MANEMALEQKVDALSEKLDAVLAKLDDTAAKDDLKLFATRNDLKLNAFGSRVDARLSKLAVGLDEVKELAKSGLEAVQILKESTERSFADATRKHDEQIELLKDVSVHVRKRVERLERTRPRRRG